MDSNMTFVQFLSFRNLTKEQAINEYNKIAAQKDEIKARVANMIEMTTPDLENLQFIKYMERFKEEGEWQD